MTIEEAIEYFKRHIDLYCVEGICREAEEMAIKALEQEPCEDWYDVPSDEMTLGQARQAVKDLRKKLAGHLEQEPLTDKEQRIFLAAMGREEKVCRDVDEKYPDKEPYEDSLMSVCQSIKRKVKKALWE